MSHGSIEPHDSAALFTPDRFPLARGDWHLAERADIADEVALVRVTVMRFAAAFWLEAKAPPFVAELRVAGQEEADRHALAEKPGEILDNVRAELLELVGEPARDLEHRLALLRSREDRDAIEAAALRIEKAAQVEIRRPRLRLPRWCSACGGPLEPVGDAARCCLCKREIGLHQTDVLSRDEVLDYSRHLELARLAVECVSGSVRAKEIQQQAGADQPIAICVGDFHPDGPPGCGRVFPDRTFPDSKGRGPNGLMFTRWCGRCNATRQRRRADGRYAERVAQRPEAERLWLAWLEVRDLWENPLSGVTSRR